MTVDMETDAALGAEIKALREDAERDAAKISRLREIIIAWRDTTLEARQEIACLRAEAVTLRLALGLSPMLR